jgi:putative DNA-invertase from lambdoid prophage Rac
MAKPKATPARQSRVFAYCRYSSEAQDKGNSIETQRAALKGICKAEGLALTGFIVDKATSGAKPLAEREHGGRMLRRLKRGDSVVALKLDRAFRSSTDCLIVAGELNKRGARLYLHDLGGWIAGTPEAEFRLTIFAGVAQFERKRCQQRILEAKAFLRTKNRFEGGDVPFGYRKVDGPSGERTRQDRPVYFIEPDPKIHAFADDLLRRGYSSRLARGEFVAHGHNVSLVAVAKLFKKLRTGCAA